MRTSFLDRVSRLALFAGMDETELSALLAELEDVTYGEGEWVVRRGTSSPGLYVIVEGEAGVVQDAVELTTLAAGSFFGEVSSLLGEPAVADVVARTRLHCLLVPTRKLEAFLLARPEIMLRMLRTEARRVRATDELRT